MEFTYMRPTLAEIQATRHCLPFGGKQMLAYKLQETNCSVPLPDCAESRDWLGNAGRKLACSVLLVFIQSFTTQLVPSRCRATTLLIYFFYIAVLQKKMLNLLKFTCALLFASFVAGQAPQAIIAPNSTVWWGE